MYYIYIPCIVYSIIWEIVFPWENFQCSVPDIYPDIQVNRNRIDCEICVNAQPYIAVVLE